MNTLAPGQHIHQKPKRLIDLARVIGLIIFLLVLTSTNADSAGSVQATSVSDGRLAPTEVTATTYTTY